jgi:hypothetical protein
MTLGAKLFVSASKSALKGYRIAWEPERMRHFSAKFEPI